MTTKQKLEDKRNMITSDNSFDQGAIFKKYYELAFKAGFDSIAPLLLEMVEALEIIESRTNKEDYAGLSILATNTLDKFNKFLEGE